MDSRPIVKVHAMPLVRPGLSLLKWRGDAIFAASVRAPK
jgi:hypothetical protein